MILFKQFVILIVWSTCFKGISAGFLDFLTVWNKPNINRDILYDFIGLVGRHNYPAEEHAIKTTDGYVLRIHRIPGNPKHSKPDGKPVILLQHGILSSSDTFVIAGPNRDLTFLLADAGYDVWLGNARGNVYNRSHEKLNPESDYKFWEFSFHEVAIYDLSAIIDFILAKTGQSSLVYIGHSLATAESLVLLSEKPNYNKKIHLTINMAPIYQWKNLRNFVKFVKQKWTFLQRLTFYLEMNEVWPLTRVVGQKANTVCNDGSILQDLCVDFAQYMSGCSKDDIDIDLLVEGFSYFPAGCSRKTFVHNMQNMEYDNSPCQFRMFDYGLIQNFMIYRQLVPPAYNLSKITTPIYMFYGLSDAVTPPEEALDLLKVLKHAKAEAVPSEKFGHLDFLWAKSAKSLLYDRVMEVIAQHQPKPKTIKRDL